LFFSLITEWIETKTFSKTIQWMRREFINYVILSNNEYFANPDTVKYNTPMNRVSFGMYYILSNFMSNVLPNITFILVTSVYFFYNNMILGTAFFISNLILFGYIYFIWDILMDYKIASENSITENESYIGDLLTNFDKIILRGQAKNEIQLLNKKTKESIEFSDSYYDNVNIHLSIMTIFIYTIVILALYYIVYLKKDNKLTTKLFVSFFTILILYRDKFTTLLYIIPNYLEFNSRLNSASTKLSDLEISGVNKLTQNTYNSEQLTFDKIEYKNVYYKYKKNDTYLFQNFNLTINANHNIVGITGLSGRGKSTLLKLLLRLYPCDQGSITIDGKDIQNIDPIYIRNNITYINQSSKLFNSKIIDNLMYGCNSRTECSKYLEMILAYPKIQKLYENVDLINGNSGSLGEGLSGGQRQIINVINGLINPSPILILDEPTNGLDADVKKDLLSIIEVFKKHKKCIIIVTHDRDVYPLFDKRIQL